MMTGAVDVNNGPVVIKVMVVKYMLINLEWSVNALPKNAEPLLRIINYISKIAQRTTGRVVDVDNNELCRELEEEMAAVSKRPERWIMYHNTAYSSQLQPLSAKRQQSLLNIHI